MKEKHFDPVTFEGEDLTGKIVFITGGATGLGGAAVRALCTLAHPPAHIIILHRPSSSTAAKDIADRPGRTTKITLVPCDMSSLSAVRNAARFVLEAVAEPGHLNILILNAGLVFAQSGGTTAEGYEPHMGVNYMANALLIRMLLPALKRAPGRNGRVVLVSSIAARLAWLGLETGPPDPAKFKDAKTPIGRSYARSKVAGVLYAIELAKRNQDDLTVLVIHPGIVDTPGTAKASLLHRTVLYIFGLLLYGGYTTPEDGCKNYLWACMAKRETVESGGFYGPVGRREKGTWHDGNEAARKVLWEWTEREVEVYAEV